MENATIKGCSPVLTALLNNMLTKQDNVIFFITPEMCQWIGLGKWAQTRSTTILCEGKKHNSSDGIKQ